MIGLYLEELYGCGLPVTSGEGDSLAGAMAEVLGMKEASIAKIWKRHPWRDGPANDELPADSELRMHKELIRRPREYFAVGVRCAGCGEVGKVPKSRADGIRMCLHCAPPFGGEN